MPEAAVGSGAVVLLHAGTFAGFLSAVREAMAGNIPVSGIEPEAGREPVLFEDARLVESDPFAARAIWRELVARCGLEVASIAKAAFFAASPGIGTHLWIHLRRILDGTDPSRGRDVLDPHSLAVLQAARAVRCEIERYRGLVRFVQARDGSMAAVIEPEHDIAAFLAPHFLARFPDQRWIVVDSRRGLAVVGESGRFEVASVDRIGIPPHPADLLRLAAPGEGEWLALWKAYFRSASVAERRNPRQQARMLPAKHRKHLPEFERARPAPAV